VQRPLLRDQALLSYNYNIAKSIVRACCRWLGYAPGDACCRWYDELAEDEAMGEEAQPTGEQLRCAPCDESDDEMGGQHGERRRRRQR